MALRYNPPLRGSPATRAGYFGVRPYPLNGDVHVFVVNTTEPYNGEVPWPANALIIVKAEGAWTEAVSQSL